MQRQVMPSLWHDNQDAIFRRKECVVDCPKCGARTTILLFKNDIPVLIFCYACINSHHISQKEVEQYNIP